MIYGVGTDVCDVRRIAATLALTSLPDRLLAADPPPAAKPAPVPAPAPAC